LNAYSELLGIMRKEGKKDNPPPIQHGIMKDATSCLAGELLLSGDDLLVVEHLKTGYHYAVDGDSPPLKDKSTYIEPLKEGDTVAVCRLDDEKYIILGRLVGL
jgi:hypothetical protein